jgi:hypothetical protein
MKLNIWGYCVGINEVLNMIDCWHETGAGMSLNKYRNSTEYRISRVSDYNTCYFLPGLHALIEFSENIYQQLQHHLKYRTQGSAAITVKVPSISSARSNQLGRKVLR